MYAYLSWSFWPDMGVGYNIVIKCLICGKKCGNYVLFYVSQCDYIVFQIFLVSIDLYGSIEDTGYQFFSFLHDIFWRNDDVQKENRTIACNGKEKH